MEETIMEQEQTSDGFLDGWDETSAPTNQTDEEESPEEPAEVDVPDAEPEAPAEEAPAEPEGAPKQWTLQHYNGDRQVEEAELVSLAQKGMDYDRIRGKYDEAKPVMELFGQYAKSAGMSIPDYLSYIRMQEKKSRGMSDEEAKRTIDLEDREAVLHAKEAEQAAENEQKRRVAADLETFRKLYPDAAKNPQSIPPDVWNAVKEKGINLVTAYAMYEAKQAKEAQAKAEQTAAAAVQNQKNAARSTGSQRTAGETTNSRDAFLEGWDS